MRLYTRFTSLLQALFRKAELDHELDDELCSYLEMLTKEKIRSGMNPAQAYREARLELGGVEQVKEQVREQRSGFALDTLIQDVRYTLRAFRKNLGFSLVAILILAIGIGANTALFSNIQSVLLRNIPFPQADRLVAGLKTWDGVVAGSVSAVDYYDYEELNSSFEGLAAMANFTTQHTDLGGDRPELIDVSHTTWNLFHVLGVSPAAGRLFTSDDLPRRSPGQVLISYRLALTRFGSPSSAVGQGLNLDGGRVAVVGVMPQGFRFIFDADAWSLVDRSGPFDTQRDSHSHLVIGRLKPQVTLQQAQGEADAIFAGLSEQYPDSNAGKGMRLAGLQNFMVSDLRPALLLLMATTGLVLVIACANVAGLLLARGERRRAELAMRTALGASRGRLLRQLLTESLILTTTAGTAGIGVAYLLLGALTRVLPTGDLPVDPPGIDGTVLAFACLMALLTGLVVGLAPALRGSGVRPASEFRLGARASEGVRSGRLRGGMVVVQVALSVALLIGSGLLVKSLMRLSTVDLGFNTENLLTAQVQIQWRQYGTLEERSQFFGSLLQEVEALPGVSSASLSSKLPIVSGGQDWFLWRAEEPLPPPQESFTAMVRWISPDYFETLEIPLLLGRDISPTDAPGDPLVVVLSETAARAVFPDSDPLGRLVHVGGEEREYEVVGVAGDARINTLRGLPDAAAYMSSAQAGHVTLQLAVRTSGDPLRLLGPLEALIQRMDPNVLLARPASMESVLDGELAHFRIVILSLTLFAGLALVLTAIGLYGIIAYHVTQRTKEMGIRLAMGASNATLLGMILRRGLVLVAVGAALGVSAAYPGTLLIRGLLFETAPLDATAYGGAVGFLSLASALACFLPAWRATRLDVVEVLRME
jgi:predicted permease